MTECEMCQAHQRAIGAAVGITLRAMLQRLYEEHKAEAHAKSATKGA